MNNRSRKAAAVMRRLFTPYKQALRRIFTAQGFLLFFPFQRFCHTFQNTDQSVPLPHHSAPQSQTYRGCRLYQVRLYLLLPGREQHYIYHLFSCRFFKIEYIFYILFLNKSIFRQPHYYFCSIIIHTANCHVSICYGFPQHYRPLKPQAR